MTSCWILQANPDRFDIEAALGELDEIRWRTPQYAASIAPGDKVMIWRSGDESGVVGVGRVTGYPAESESSEPERRYTRGAEPDALTTRVPLSVRPTGFIPKRDVAATRTWEEHPIVIAPMGTVFPVSGAQWEAIEPRLAALPTWEAATSVSIPPTFAWDQRRKDVYPLPGGYAGALDSLRSIVRHAVEARPNHEAMCRWLSESLELSETSARMTLGFLVRIGVLHDSADVVVPSAVARAWTDTGQHELIIGLLHSRTRYIGELLDAARQPRTDQALLDDVNERFQADWKTRTQIRRRRGWLQSAGFLAETDDGRLQATAAGRKLLERLTLQPPLNEPSARVTEETDVDDPKEQPLTETQVLIKQLRESGNHGGDADAFERDTAEAFSRLGFRAEWLGKSGRTDVLLSADLGRGASYRAIVDCKSTGRGTVSQAIDWETIDEHRKQHEADFALIVAPGFGGGKLLDRATRHNTVLMTIDDLAELLVQHEQLPLSLDAYRLLFEADSLEEGVKAIGETYSEAERRLELVDAVLDLLDRFGSRMAPMSARDFFLLLATDDAMPDVAEPEIDDVLVALSAPLVGVLRRDADGRVRLTSRRTTSAQALRAIANRIEHGSHEDE